MTKALAVFLLLFGLAALSDLAAPRPLALDDAVTVAAGGRLDLGGLAATNAAERYVIEIMIRGRARLILGDQVMPLADGTSGCRTDGDRTHCRVAWQRPGLDRLEVAIEADGPVRIERVDARRVTAKTATPLIAADFTHLGLVVAVAIPLVWMLHWHVAASQWAIVAASVAALALVQPGFTVLLLVFLLAMYRLGTAMQAARAAGVGLLVSLMAMAFALLAAYKFALPQLGRLFSNVGGFDLIMPLGLSYFVIRLIDTQLKWYRGQLKGIGLREYLSFMVFAPTIPAGPIETLDAWRHNRLARIGPEDVAYGVGRIAIGAGKKIFIADTLLLPLVNDNIFAVAADPAAAAPTQLAALLLGNFLFAYVDFSAYSDIAIGLGRLFGYRIRENFNWPILRANLREYWQNWHMSLSNWAMRNVFMPMALATKNNILPIFFTMLTIGLWHDFGLPWFLWAVHHGTGLALLFWLDARFRLPRSSPWLRWGRPLRVTATVGFVAMGHSFVMFDDVRTAVAVYLRAIGGFGLLW